VYPGASPQTMNDAVVSLIERELSGVKNLLYFESSTDTSGSFDHRHLQARHQSRTGAGRRAEPPEGHRTAPAAGGAPERREVESASSSFLMMVSLNSTRGHNEEACDYLARNVVEELRRMPGVGRVQLFGAERPCGSGSIRPS
jgi:multidrug efflux pump